MDTRALITAGLFVMIGLAAAINPRLAFDVRAWFGRQVLDRRAEPSAPALLFYRLVGAAFVVIGGVMLVNALT